MIPNLNNYIDGKWVPGESTFEARNPADDEVIATVPESTPSDVDAAIHAAIDTYGRTLAYVWTESGRLFKS